MKVLVDGQTLRTGELDRGIGRVFLQLFEALIEHDISHEWILLAPEDSDFSRIRPQLFNRFSIINLPAHAIAGENFEERAESLSNFIEDVCEEEDIDLYWTPNGMMMNVILPYDLKGVKTAITLHDLIPLMMAEEYLEKWPADVRDQYLRRVEALKSWSTLLFCISNSVKRQITEQIGVVKGHLITASNAASHAQHWPLTKQSRESAKESCVTLISGDDARKDPTGFAEAFDRFVAKYPEWKDIELNIICRLSDGKKSEIESLARVSGWSDRLAIKGFVSDEELTRIIRGSACVAMHSKLEGFGLPILEALLSGVPVIASDIPSSREVGGGFAEYYTFGDLDETADALNRALHHELEGRFDRNAAVKWARKFDWLKTAQVYSEEFHKFGARAFHDGISRPTVAMLTPWPPQKSGIATFSWAIAEKLREKCDLTIVTDDCPDSKKMTDVKFLSLEKMEAKLQDFDQVIAHVGNNTRFHKGIYEFCMTNPCDVVLHDPNIHAFLQDAFTSKSQTDYYNQAKQYLVRNSDDRSLAEKATRDLLAVFDTPLNGHLASTARRVFVHSREAANAIKTDAPKAHVSVVPLSLILQHDLNEESSGVLANEDSETHIFGVFGFLSENKRPLAAIRALAELVDRGIRAKLMMVGKLDDPAGNIASLIDELNLADCVVQTGFVSEREFWEYIRMCDVVLSLRYPTLGESSGVVSIACREEKPLIVTDVGQFSELPDSIAWKVPPSPDLEVPVLTEYLAHLFKNPETRREMGTRALKFAKSFWSLDGYTDRLLLQGSGEGARESNGEQF